MIIGIVIAIAVGLFVVERLWPSMELPKVRTWWLRVGLINLIQLGIVIVAGFTWDRWLQAVSLFNLAEHLNDFWQASIAYLLSTFVYYWWHRLRHESRLFWLLCHQLHHSPRRIEIVTSFYKHPVEIMMNSLISASIVYVLLGCTVQAGVYYTLMTAIAEFFYHWNITTPHWLGFIIQRPESHRVHHQYHHHTNNFADLPIFDIMFGTFQNPKHFEATCGYDDWREDRFEDLLAFRDVNDKDAQSISPLHLLPTCIGCSKRWACTESRQRAAEKQESSPSP